ncbi:MAG: ATP-dependent Clp protease adapter ClpS [Gammaproteobacteria bacterium]|nr:ATP-dependent Clp protease adapter ClpS [Gammaproteobacteria bacterium]
MKSEVINNCTEHWVVQPEVTNSEPQLYLILIHNDHYTPMEFVVALLEKFFNMDRVKATSTMLEAHMKGKAACGVFTKDVAETKITLTLSYARNHEHPLICSMEAAHE